MAVAAAEVLSLLTIYCAVDKDVAWGARDALQRSARKQ